jgi:hypothetical protein
MTGRHVLFFLRPIVVIVDSVPFGKHTLVQDTRNQNACCVLTVKHDVPTALHAAKVGTNIVTRPAQRGVVGEHPATRFKIVDVTDALVVAPRAKRIGADGEQVGLGPTRKTKRGHRLSRRSGKVECFPHASEHVALGNTAGVTLIDRGPQRG